MTLWPWRWVATRGDIMIWNTSLFSRGSLRTFIKVMHFIHTNPVPWRGCHIPYFQKVLVVLMRLFYYFQKVVVVLMGLFCYFQKVVVVLMRLFYYFHKVVVVLMRLFYYFQKVVVVPMRLFCYFQKVGVVLMRLFCYFQKVLVVLMRLFCYFQKVVVVLMRLFSLGCRCRGWRMLWSTSTLWPWTSATSTCSRCRHESKKV